MRPPDRASYVVDASVVVKWHVPEELSDAADVLLDRLEAGELSLLAPALLPAERQPMCYGRSSSVGN